MIYYTGKFVPLFWIIVLSRVCTWSEFEVFKAVDILRKKINDL